MVALALGRGCSATLSRQALRGCGPMVLGPTTAQRGRWLGSGGRPVHLKLITRRVRVIQHHRMLAYFSKVISLSIPALSTVFYKSNIQTNEGH